MEHLYFALLRQKSFFFFFYFALVLSLEKVNELSATNGLCSNRILQSCLMLAGCFLFPQSAGGDYNSRFSQLHSGPLVKEGGNPHRADVGIRQKGLLGRVKMEGRSPKRTRNSRVLYVAELQQLLTRSVRDHVHSSLKRSERKE